jgi:hypothetical protein
MFFALLWNDGSTASGNLEVITWSLTQGKQGINNSAITKGTFKNGTLLKQTLKFQRNGAKTKV